MRESVRKLSSGKTAAGFTRAYQHKLEAAPLQFVDNSRQSLQHYVCPSWQAIVQQDNVPALRFAQNAVRKKT